MQRLQYVTGCLSFVIMSSQIRSTKVLQNLSQYLHGKVPKDVDRGVRRTLFRGGGAKLTFCKFPGTVAVKIFFWRSIFSKLCPGTLFASVTSIMAEKVFLTRTLAGKRSFYATGCRG